MSYYRPPSIEVNLACGDTRTVATVPGIGAYRHCPHCDSAKRVTSVHAINGLPVIDCRETAQDHKCSGSWQYQGPGSLTGIEVYVCDSGAHYGLMQAP